MKSLFKTGMLSLIAAGLLTGCVVYEPRPRVYAEPAYIVYDGPSVVYVHGGYYHRGCWR